MLEGGVYLIEMVTKCELLKVVSHISSCLVLSAF